jgi:hypothetical protein
MTPALGTQVGRNSATEACPKADCFRPTPIRQISLATREPSTEDTLRGAKFKSFARVLGRGSFGAVADVVETDGGVVSGLFNEPQPAFERRRRQPTGNSKMRGQP